MRAVDIIKPTPGCICTLAFALGCGVIQEDPPEDEEVIAAVVTTDGRIAEWTLNWNARGSSVDEGDLLWNGTPSYVAGKIGGAANLANGSTGLGTSYLTAANSPALDDFQTDSYTLSAWIKPASTPANTNTDNDQAFIVGKQGWALGLAYLPTGKVRMREPLRDGPINVDSTTVCQPGQWCHVVGVVQRWNGKVQLYVNATLQGDATFDGREGFGENPPLDQSSNPVRIGIRSPTGPYRRPFNGAIDQVRIYAKALSAAEIQGLYTETAGPWRPFNATSPWNTRISANPTLHTQSAALIDDWKWSVDGVSNPYLKINIESWSAPLFWAHNATPTVPVKARSGGYGWMGNDIVAPVPWPNGAWPDPQRDHHLVIVNQEASREWGCWDLQYSSSTTPAWNAGSCSQMDLSGSGVRPARQALLDSGGNFHEAVGPRACGFPLIAGLIRTEEIEAGVINHALVMAYPNIMHNKYVSPPASTSQSPKPDGSGGWLTSDWGIPCGGRIQFDPSIDVDSLGLSRSGRIIMKALQQYGAYVGDYGGSITVYAEDSPAAQAFWATNLSETELKDKVNLSDFRVLQYPSAPIDDWYR